MARIYDTYEPHAKKVLQQALDLEYVEARNLLVRLPADELSDIENLAMDLLHIVHSAKQVKEYRQGSLRRIARTFVIVDHGVQRSTL